MEKNGYLTGIITKNNIKIKFLIKEKDYCKVVALKNYNPLNYNCLLTVLLHFFDENQIERLSYYYLFCVEGLIHNNDVDLNYLNWKIDIEKLKNELNAKNILIMNSNTIKAHQIPYVPNKQLINVNKMKKPKKFGPKMIIGIGHYCETAINISNEYENNRTVFNSQAFKKDFSPRNNFEFLFLKHLFKIYRTPRVSVERALSLSGLEQAYDFYLKNHPNLVCKEINVKLNKTKNKWFNILNFSNSKKNNILFTMAIKFYCNLLGSEVGNMAMSIVPTGGIYLVGELFHLLNSKMLKIFLEEFYNKGCVRKILCTIPIYLVNSNYPLQEKGLKTITEKFFYNNNSN